jgi:hypothetical protein
LELVRGDDRLIGGAASETYQQPGNEESSGSLEVASKILAYYHII